MDIIIAGAGKVGFNLARTLSAGHSVTVIDRNAEALARLQENLDILPIHGDIEDPETYQKLVDHKTDLFIAVTDIDEANLVCTLIADDVIDIGRKFIRLKNTFFAKSSIKEKLGITEAIFPSQLTSNTIVSLLDYPKANNIKQFKYTDFKLISVHASKTMEILNLHPKGYAVVGIEREKSFFIPKEDDPVFPDDLVYLFGQDDPIRELCGVLETDIPKTIGRCVVFGAGNLGITIARALIENGKEVKLIEKDVALCENADDQLSGGAMTISCKYGTTGLFEEEGLKHADMVIAATDNDEYNIIKCIEAREHGIHKVIAVNNEMEYYNLMHALGIIVVRGPKMSAYNEIIEHIYSSGVVMERKFCGGKAGVFLRKIFPESKLIGKRLKPPKFKGSEGVFVLRDDQIKRFNDEIEGQEGDDIIIFCTDKYTADLKRWIYGL